MKISILLPYKENFSSIYAGAVSLFIRDTVKLSKFKESITIFGNTKLKKIFKLKYKNINLKKNMIQSGSKLYVREFLKSLPRPSFLRPAMASSASFSKNLSISSCCTPHNLKHIKTNYKN